MAREKRTEILVVGGWQEVGALEARKGVRIEYLSAGVLEPTRKGVRIENLSGPPVAMNPVAGRLEAVPRLQENILAPMETMAGKKGTGYTPMIPSGPPLPLPLPESGSCCCRTNTDGSIAYYKKDAENPLGCYKPMGYYDCFCPGEEPKPSGGEKEVCYQCVLGFGEYDGGHGGWGWSQNHKVGRVFKMKASEANKANAYCLKKYDDPQTYQDEAWAVQVDCPKPLDPPEREEGGDGKPPHRAPPAKPPIGKWIDEFDFHPGMGPGYASEPTMQDPGMCKLYRCCNPTFDHLGNPEWAWTHHPRDCDPLGGVCGRPICVLCPDYCWGCARC